MEDPLVSLNLNLLVSLRALLQEGGVGAAARRVGVTQSAMSRSLAQLREIFDDPLLVRVGREMVPTVRAEALRAPLEGALGEVERVLRADVGFAPERSERTFRVATSDALGATVLPALIHQLDASAPGVGLQVVALDRDELVDGLRAGRIDAALAGPLTEPGIDARVLFEDAWAVARWEGSAPVDDLAAYVARPHVLVSPMGRPGSVVGRALAERGLTRRVAAEVPWFLAAAGLVVGSDRLLTAPRHVLTAQAERYGLAIDPLPVELPPFLIARCVHHRSANDPAVRWLGERLEEVVGAGLVSGSPAAPGGRRGGERAR